MWQSQGGGRFAVVDDTGVAVVDDDYLLVWAARQPAPDPHREGGLLVTQGIEVDVVGPARSGEAADAAELAPTGYRERSRPLVFDGRRDAPIAVLV